MLFQIWLAPPSLASCLGLHISRRKHNQTPAADGVIAVLWSSLGVQQGMELA
jgi:hypothetical protein